PFLAAVVDPDLHVGTGLAQMLLKGRGEAGRRVGPGDQGDELPAAGQHPVQDVPGDLREVRADGDDIALDDRQATRIRWGRPASMPASMAAPASSTWTCTFHSPSPPTTTSESPRPSSLPRSSWTASSGASSRYMTSSPGPRPPESGGSARSSGGGIAAVRAGTSYRSGYSSAATAASTSRTTQSPAAPASTTPLRASTSSCPVVRSSA